MNVLPFYARVRIASCLVEGMSIRSTERLLDIHRDTIMRFGVTAGEACQRLHDQIARGLQPSVIECDEAWTYCFKKQGHRKPTDPADWGDQYCFLALDGTSKFIISSLVDKRNGDAARRFMADLRARVVGAPMICTDGFDPYPEAVELAFGSACQYATLVKSYHGEKPGGPQYQHRYSPGRLESIRKTRVSGKPNMDRVSTSFIERENLNLRMSQRRFTRLCNGFSKKLRNLRAAVALYTAHHNLVRVHESLRVTPAMAIGITDTPWTMADLLGFALGTEANAAA